MEPLRAPRRFGKPRDNDGISAAGWVTAMVLTLFVVIVAIGFGRNDWTLRLTQSGPAEQVTERTAMYECSDHGQSWQQSEPCPVRSQIEVEASRPDAPLASEYNDQSARRWEIEQRNRAAEQRLLADADARYRREVQAAQRNSVALREHQIANSTGGTCAALKSEKIQIQERMRRQGYSIKEGEWLDGQLRHIFRVQNEANCSDR